MRRERFVELTRSADGASIAAAGAMMFRNSMAALAVVATVGCSSSSSSAPTAPSRQGQIELAVSPTSVSYAGGAGVGGPICPVPYTSRWGPYALTIRETGGMPVTITSLLYVVTTGAGEQVSSEEITAGLSDRFFGVTDPTLRVPANGSVSSRQHYDCERERNGRPDFPGGAAVFTVRGTDEEGRPVSAEATLTLLPPS